MGVAAVRFGRRAAELSRRRGGAACRAGAGSEGYVRRRAYGRPAVGVHDVSGSGGRGFEVRRVRMPASGEESWTVVGPDARPVALIDEFSNQSVSRNAARTWRAARLDPIGLHECRHTFASLMIAAASTPRRSRPSSATPP
jgi:hypothetical protein